MFGAECRETMVPSSTRKKSSETAKKCIKSIKEKIMANWQHINLGLFLPILTANFRQITFSSRHLSELRIVFIETIKINIFYYVHSNYGALTDMEYESEEKNSNFKFLAGCFAIWKFEIS